jgi:mannose-1-phosphate guanylyltransferase
MNKEFLALSEATIAADANVSGGSVIGRRSRIESLAQIDGSVIGDGAVIGAGARLKNCFVADGFEVPAHVIAIDNYFGF